MFEKAPGKLWKGTIGELRYPWDQLLGIHCCSCALSAHTLPAFYARVAVAPAGATVLDDEGEEMELKKTTVSGVVSEGMLCDSRMLGWAGGAAGLAVQIPDDFDIGSAPPSSKPRKGDETKSEGAAASKAEGLFEKKMTKEEKKKLAEEKRKARKTAKETRKEEES